MPLPQALLQAFHLVKGTICASYRLVTATSTHVMEEKYKRYAYHVKLHFSVIKSEQGIHTTPKEQKTLLLASLQKLTGDSRTVNSQYGNPYHCVFLKDRKVQSTKDCSNVFLELDATANRITM